MSVANVLEAFVMFAFCTGVLTIKRKEPNLGFAASTIGIMLSMLQEQYTDAQIKRMLTRKKLTAVLGYLRERDKQRMLSTVPD